MNPPVHILGLCGSLRPGSYTRQAATIVLDAAHAEGASTALASDVELNLPLCDGRPEQAAPGAVIALRERVRRADALLLATPEYCGTLSAVLKNAIEWIGPEILAGKIIGVVSVAASTSADGSMVALRELCLREGAWVIPARASVPMAERVFGLPDDEFSSLVLAHLHALGTALPEAVNRIDRNCTSRGSRS
ncbi:MAG TPA: hypothetical protein DDZ76_15285 [Xanthomonadales bacterium]|nr:hypothetical protein [Xanthomonadales bacterium]